MMKDLHVGDRVVIFEWPKALRGAEPAPGRYIAHTIKTKRWGRVVLDGGQVVLARQVIAVELKHGV